MYRIHFLLILVLLSFSIEAQISKQGGFSEGWNSYDNSTTTGLGPRVFDYDYTGVHMIDTVPAVYIHPRVYFGPSEIPDIKQRLETTTSGMEVDAQIHAYTTLLHLGYNGSGTYNHNEDYAKDAFGNRRIDNAGKWNAFNEYYKLINQDETVWDGLAINRRHLTASIMALEAFECLIHSGEHDDDTGLSYDDRALLLAEAMTFWAGLALEDTNVDPSNYNLFGGVHMALAYDMNYNSMTTSQRDTVRQALSKIIIDEPRHGAWIESYIATSNWAGLNSFEILTNLAIEGEPGYKPALTERWVRAYHNFISYGWYPSGAGYEGLGKNYMFATTAIALAKRGYSVLGHPHMKQYAKSFLPAIMQPFGHGFTSYDVWGGSGYDDQVGGYKFNSADAIGLKYIFPEDPKVDFLWRNYIEKSYNLDSEGYVYQQIFPDDSYHNYLLVAGIFSQDYETGSWATQSQENETLDYFAADRGLVIAKTGFDEQSLALQFHCRQDNGGHTHGDRNDFTLSSHGRIWIRKSYGGSQFQPSTFHSMVLVDGKGVGVGDPDGDKCRQPGKILDYNSSNSLTSVVADATKAYSYEWHWSARPLGSDHPWLGTNNWESVQDKWNDYQYIPSVESHYNIAYYDMPHWTQPFRFERMVKRPYNMMEKVTRTVAVIKSDKPYVIISDNIKKDGDPHQYEWLGQLARDLTIESTTTQLTNSDYKADIILKEPAVEGNRRLLIRVLHNENFDGSTPVAIMDTIQYEDYFTGAPYTSNPNLIRPRLKIQSTSINPYFKVLLYPHMDGDQLPTTSWNGAKDSLTVTFNEFTDHITFEETIMGYDEINITGDCGMVNNTNDSGVGSLRAVIACTENNEIVNINPLLKDSIIEVESSEIIIDKNLTIKGNSAWTHTISGSNNSSNTVNLFNVEAGMKLTLDNLNLVNSTNNLNSTIVNDGILILSDVQITGNGSTLHFIQNNGPGEVIVKGKTNLNQ